MTDAAPLERKHILLQLEDLLVRGLVFLLTAVFALIFLLVTVLVVMRYGFNRTIIGGAEAVVMLFIYTTALGASVDIARGKHIRIDTFVNLLPARLRNGIEVMNIILIGILQTALFYYSLQWIGVVGNSLDPVLRIPEAIVETAIPIGCLFSVMFCGTRLFAMMTAPLSASGSERG